MWLLQSSWCFLILHSSNSYCTQLNCTVGSLYSSVLGCTEPKLSNITWHFSGLVLSEFPISLFGDTQYICQRMSEGKVSPVRGLIILIVFDTNICFKPHRIILVFNSGSWRNRILHLKPSERGLPGVNPTDIGRSRLLLPTAGLNPWLLRAHTHKTCFWGAPHHDDKHAS